MNTTINPAAGASRAVTLDEAAGQTHTLREIRQQPAVWQQMAAAMATQRAPLGAFLAPLQGQAQTRIVLTGAGSSAYIGDALAPALTRCGLGCVTSVPTTDIVSDPPAWLPREVPTLLVSFARSGNSPESLAAVERADAALTQCRHLVVSCHAEGALHRWATQQRHAHALDLPEATHDRSFAMTSSFSTMLMSAGMALGALDDADVAAAAADAAQVLATAEPLITELVARRFERIVYLGSCAH